MNGALENNLTEFGHDPSKKPLPRILHLHGENCLRILESIFHDFELEFCSDRRRIVPLLIPLNSGCYPNFYGFVFWLLVIHKGDAK